MRLRDQRDMHGAPTIEAQHERWADHLARHGLTMTEDRRVVIAYVSDGRWVAQCPECNGGIACWDENPHGCCLDCGHVYRVKFPADHKIAEAILLQRPVNGRHWLPGEPVVQLEVENRHFLRGEF